MARRGARALHLALWLLGAVLYIFFVIPRWWVLTGDIAATAGTVGRIAAGLPIAAAAVPVALLLRAALREDSAGEAKVPEIALRLRAWSTVLHVVAGVLIVLTAVAEVWLHSPAAGPWLYALYGAAGSIAILAALAFVLSFTAEKPSAPPKVKVKKAKAPKQRKRRKGDVAATEAVEGASEDSDEPSDDKPVDDTSSETPDVVETEDSGALRNKRPTGKSRLRSRS